MTIDKRTGIERIADERRRQTERLGWTASHDDEHDEGSLAMAAACYAAPERIYTEERYASAVSFCDPFPWGDHYDARKYNGNVPTPETATRAERIRLLEKAGALIAAEIDRLLRLEES